MLSVVAMVLAFCGFEQNHFGDENVLSRMHVAIAGTAIVSFLIFNVLLSKQIYTKWWLLVLAIIANVMIYVSLNQWSYLLQSCVHDFLNRNCCFFCPSSLMADLGMSGL